MSDENGFAPTILRLRVLREKLCESQDDWKQAFEVRDFVISELNTLSVMLEDDNVKKSDCAAVVRGILENFGGIDHG